MANKEIPSVNWGNEFNSTLSRGYFTINKTHREVFEQKLKDWFLGLNSSVQGFIYAFGIYTMPLVGENPERLKDLAVVTNDVQVVLTLKFEQTIYCKSKSDKSDEKGRVCGNMSFSENYHIVCRYTHEGGFKFAFEELTDIFLKNLQDFLKIGAANFGNASLVFSEGVAALESVLSPQ